MWREYSIEFIRKNRTSSLSIIAAAFLSALFLSLLCSSFFNFWRYEIEEIMLEEGDWQGRITGAFNEDTVKLIENFSNVKKVEMREEASDNQSVIIDICFQNMRTIYEDMPRIAEKLGVEDSAVSYHDLLLSRYLIHDPQDAEPPLLMAFYLLILFTISISLILIIHNSFAVFMNARIHQFGIFSSIGATPGQICTCLLQEAAALCILPILLGNFVGILLSFGVIQLINLLAAGISGRHEAVFTYHPLVFAITILSTVLTVFFSAWMPAIKLSRLTPLAAIRNNGELQLKKEKTFCILSKIFGIEGELAANALRVQKKALRTSTLSLTLSFMGFTLMLCFFTLSRISTNHTYFERYQDAWDVMATIEDVDIETFTLEEKISKLNGINSVIYQKAKAICLVPKISISNEVNRLGGLEAVAGNSVHAADGFYSISSPIVIMDDNSFEEYCKQIGREADIIGSIVLNRIWDSVNTNFRYKKYVPFILEEQNTITLQNIEQVESKVTIPVLAYTQETPVLREEYENYALVQFIPLSLWKQISNIIGNTEEDTYLRVLAEGEATLSKLNRIETELSKIIGQDYRFEMENRIQEKKDNDTMLNGYMWIIGAFCLLLATIGIANVFSYTLGFVRQRKREFARYMSIGMTPEEMWKLFCIEVFIIAGRPVFFTLPLTVVSVSFMIRASHLNPGEFLAQVPIIPIIIFILTIFVFVALAYHIGGKKIMKCSLIEALRSNYIG